jgi:hypothetical protein
MTARYRKKPVVIQAMRYDGSNAEAIHIWAGDVIGGWARGEDGFPLTVMTLEGALEAQKGDWIIRGVKGEFYPVKPDIFEATYEPIE